MKRLFRRTRRRLFWRVYLNGVLLLLAVGLAMVVSASLMDLRPAWERAHERASRYLSADLGPLIDQPKALGDKLEILRQVFESDIAVYADHGELIAAAGSPPPPRPQAPPTALEMRHRHGRLRLTVPLRDRRAYVVVQSQRRMGHGRLLAAIGVILAVLALVSLPLARAIVRPVERLTETARMLGRGDLSARSGVSRSDEVGELARALDEMAGRLEILVARERTLLANVSHELRTPLARIRVALELAEETSDDAATIRSHLSGIGADLAELESLIEDVFVATRLDLAARGSGGGLPVNLQTVAVEPIVRAAAARFAQLHPHHTLMTDVGQIEIDADAQLLRRVVDNLLDNAARYVDADAGPIEVIARARDERVRLEVRDRGIGVDPSDLPHLFDPFFRTDASRARATGGVGLGLALCQRIIEAHGGEIGAFSHASAPEADASPGSAHASTCGTTFWLELPRSADVAARGIDPPPVKSPG